MTDESGKVDWNQIVEELASIRNVRLPDVNGTTERLDIELQFVIYLFLRFY